MEGKWERGAVGTAVWTGVRLADVLKKAKPRPTARHVVPNGHDAPPTPQTPDFIRSHPIWKAMDPHTMLALQMNGKPVSPEEKQAILDYLATSLGP